MLNIKTFVFNSFRENTFVLFDETKECVIIDAGCSLSKEKEQIKDFVKNNGLVPKVLLNTHCHIDHVFGNMFVYEEYGLLPQFHSSELYVLRLAPQVGEMYGVGYPEISPEPESFLNDGDIVKFGNTELRCLLTPGHSPGSICFYSEKDKVLISGDVLFHSSIGRTDLPGGDYDTLIRSIKTKLMVLDEDTKVYPGHELTTTIGYEKKYNRFL